ncbi:methionyl-tRNA formyltransferase [Caproiciproducens galactitolivorans]|uniref:Methionyl-tRNA formyltransferase n=1 Tax=Caproiciproducens galactitolivorans TaxID=642589 RepID=A0A4Z0YAQ2_9FIRM|nr:methionyl-tRNA formyltransferase [Caproiciproducens galactitolivorans]QEY34034.1 methionyl-tRNA formyltransferase [Caproiciproducens galactitolivorans]TGJ76555.1 methionyl-tRNA formyltransferase [Caproiciproducens galactitolivorans]
MRIIFMGTPDFAVPCLQSIIEKHTVCAVFTQPDKPKGRGYALTPPPVKVLSQEKNIPVYQPKTLRTEEAAQLIRDLHPDAIVVVAYGKILPKEILAVPPYGCINVHASLLPKYRGAAPIQWAVINGEKETGVTTMYMAEGLDTGDMLLKEKIEIGSEETAGELHDRLSQLGAELIIKTLEGIEKGAIQRIPQGDSETCYASMLTKELSHIDWNKPAQEIHNLVRGLSPWPVADTTFHGKLLKIYKTKIVDGYSGEAGHPVNANGVFIVCCGGNTALELLEVQYEGKKRMSGKDFLRGHPIGEEKILR